MIWAGAYNPLWYVSDKRLYEIRADKQPIGYIENPSPFTNHTINLKSSDWVYLFTDGYADQFGGAKGKKFKYKQFEELVLANHHFSIEEQKKIYIKQFEAWRGDLDQVDDVTVFGIQIV